jgi:hypothetical protein
MQQNLRNIALIRIHRDGRAPLSADRPKPPCRTHAGTSACRAWRPLPAACLLTGRAYPPWPACACVLGSRAGSAKEMRQGRVYRASQGLHCPPGVVEMQRTV